MHARTILTIVSLALVALLLMLDTESVSPGSLSLVHAAETGLQSVDSCSACHGHLFKSMTSACNDCHEEIEQQVDDRAGFHGQLSDELSGACASCHSEHHGAGFSLVSDRSFLRAGFRGRDGYDHRGLDFGLLGIHSVLRCDDCHEHADAKVVPLGSSRFLGLDQTCTACHEDEHQGEYGTDCASCHGQTRAFAEVGGAAHATFAPLVGTHVTLACEECHAPDTPESVDALARRHVAGDESFPPRDCASCHTSLHSEDFLDGVAASAGRLPDGRTCQHCHDAANDGFLGESVQMPPALHAASGFALELPHDAVECLGCHTGFGQRALLDDPVAQATAFAEAFPGRNQDTCSACHMDVHNGQFQDSRFAADDCLGCHDRTAFAPTAFGIEHHARTAFALAGSHATAECEACHALPEGQPRITEDGFVSRQFAGTSVMCSACHESPHREMFVEGVHTRIGSLDAEACARCHDAVHETFLGDNGSMTGDLHAASGFPLEEPHHEVSCEDCHAGFGVRAAEPSSDGRRAEFALVFPGREALDCVACHQDPHLEQFSGGEFAGDDCISCHDPHGFRPPLFGFTHHARTDFALTGSHEAVGCNECHLVPDGLPARTDAGLLSRIFEGTRHECAACHVDVHDGRFDRQGLPKRVDGNDGCSRCHTTESFGLRRFQIFDHGLWAGYELRGAHREATCEGCHQVERSVDPPRLTFGTVRGTECSGCHVDSHVGQFAVDGVTDCERCHQETLSFDDLVFDHQTDSRYALDEVHVQLECAACHKALDVAGVQAVRYKPLGVDCSDCHDPTGLQLLRGSGR